MIAHLRGKVSARRDDTVVIDVGGVGYLVHITDPGSVPPRGQPVELHTSLQVREDAMDLYGFGTRDDLELFELLMGTSGVGPKLAMASLRTHPARVLRRAIAGEDLATLTAIPGIGKKSGQRILLELKDKVAIPGETDVVHVAGAPGASSPLGEAREALLALGYSASEVQAAVADLDADGAEVADLVRRALKDMAGAGSMR